MFPNDSKKRIDLAIDISLQKPNIRINLKLQQSFVIVIRLFIKTCRCRSYSFRNRRFPKLKISIYSYFNLNKVL